MTADTSKDQKPSAGDSASKVGEFDWFDRPESRRLLWRLLYGACIVAILLEIVLIVTHQRHSHFGSHAAEAATATVTEGSTTLHEGDDHHVPTFDGWWFFYSVLGFLGCALMILSAKGLGYLLKKPTDYYGDDTSAKDEPLPEDIDDALR